MTIVIVEDEPRVREGIVHIISSQTKHKILNVFDQAETALREILIQPPDLVITDIKMGEMDGLAMLSQIRAHGIQSAFIVLTGYSSFDYARQAIHLRVSEYLLKPITPEDLLESLKKVEQIGTEAFQKQQQTPQQWLASQFVSGNMDAEKTARLLQNQYEINPDAQHSMLLFQLKSVDRESFFWVTNQIREKSAMLCMENTMLLELFAKQSILMLIFQSDRNPSTERNLEEYILPEIQQEVQCICLYHSFYGLENLKQEYEACLNLKPYSLLIDQHQLISKAKISALPNQQLKYPDDLEQKIKLAVCSRDSEQTLKLSQEFKNLIFSGNYTPESMTNTMIRFLCTLCVTAEENDSRIKGNFDYTQLVNHVHQSSSQQELCEYFDNLVQRTIEQHSDDHYEVQNLIVSKMINYIRKHYMEEITLSLLSFDMDLTPEYLSNLFTKEMGINFSSFLKNFRISRAKQLLEQDSIKIHEIALQVGFRDPKYFNRVFRDVCGVSPSEYRNYKRRL